MLLCYEKICGFSSSSNNNIKKKNPRYKWSWLMGYKFQWKNFKEKISKKIKLLNLSYKADRSIFCYALYFAGSFCFNLHINRKLWFLFMKWNIHIFSTCDFKFHNTRRKEEKLRRNFLTPPHTFFLTFFMWKLSLFFSLSLTHSLSLSFKQDFLHPCLFFYLYSASVYFRLKSPLMIFMRTAWNTKKGQN